MVYTLKDVVKVSTNLVKRVNLGNSLQSLKYRFLIFFSVTCPFKLAFSYFRQKCTFPYFMFSCKICIGSNENIRNLYAL